MNKDNQEKRNYELATLLKNKEDASSVETVLGQYGAEIIYRSPVAETRLAYPIKKQNSAYFIFFQFSASPNEIEKIVHSLKLSPAVLRMLAVTSPVIANSNKPFGTVLEEKSFRNKPEISAVFNPVAKGGTLTNEDLEEKLEEILK